MTLEACAPLIATLPLEVSFKCSSSWMVIVVFIYTCREIKHDVFTQTSSDIQTSYGVSSEYDN